MSRTDPTHRQVAPLRGRVALHTAVVGAVMIGTGALMAWMQWSDPWPLVAFGAVVFVPILTLGGFVLGLAALWQFRRAEWQLTADREGVALVTQTARGRILKSEAVAAAQMERLTWVAGDADISAGLRFEARTRKDLFIPAESFDCAALAAFAVRTYPHAAAPTLVDQVQGR